MTWAASWVLGVPTLEGSDNLARHVWHRLERRGTAQAHSWRAISLMNAFIRLPIHCLGWNAPSPFSGAPSCAVVSALLLFPSIIHFQTELRVPGHRSCTLRRGSRIMPTRCLGHLQVNPQTCTLVSIQSCAHDCNHAIHNHATEADRPTRMHTHRVSLFRVRPKLHTAWKERRMVEASGYLDRSQTHPLCA